MHKPAGQSRHRRRKSHRPFESNVFRPNRFWSKRKRIRNRRARSRSSDRCPRSDLELNSFPMPVQSARKSKSQRKANRRTTNTIVITIMTMTTTSRWTSSTLNATLRFHKCSVVLRRWLCKRYNRKASRKRKWAEASGSPRRARRWGEPFSNWASASRES